MLDILAQAIILHGIPPAGLVSLAQQGQRRVFGRGSQLLRQGQRSQSIQVILAGRVRLERWHPDLSGPVPLAERGVGEVVGELGMLVGEPCSVTVSALESTETLEVSATALALTVARFPEIKNPLLHKLSRRMLGTGELGDHLVSQGWKERQP